MCVSTYLDECLPTPAEDTWMQGELLQLSRSCPWFQKKYQHKWPYLEGDKVWEGVEKEEFLVEKTINPGKAKQEIK